MNTEDSARRRRSTARRAERKSSPIVLALAVALAATACGKHESRPAQPPIPAVAASLVKAERSETGRRVELYGTVEAERSASVSSRVMGNVVAVRVKAGDPVRAGDVLVEIAPETARGQESQARGALSQATSALALAERNFQRYEALAKSGSASELELDLARMQLGQARGAVEQAKGAVAAASSVANESRVVAPFAGRVTARLVEAGDFAAPGRPVATIESTTGRRLVVSVPESLVAGDGLAIGSKLPVTIDALPGKSLTGVVAERTPGADPATHAFTVKLDLTGATELATGLTGRAFLETGAQRSVVSIPRSAVLPAGGITSLTMVVIRDPGGKARSRAVTLGAGLPGDRVEVLSGLAGDETLLTGLLAAPADGAPVNELTK